MNPNDQTRGSTTRIPVRNAAPQSLTQPDDPFARVYRELQDGIFDQGLWMKSLAENHGDADKAQAVYVTRRVKQLGVTAPATKKPLAGVHGWLRFYCFIVGTVFPLRALLSFSGLSSRPTGMPRIEVNYGWINCGLALALAVLGTQVWKKLRNDECDGLEWNKWLLGAGVFASIIRAMGLWILANNWADALAVVLVSSFWAGAWWLYFRNSRRVFNTYGYNP